MINGHQHLPGILRIVVSIALVILSITYLPLAQTLTEHEASEYPQDEPAYLHDYVIGPGDVLNINVWREPEITGKYVVGPDGYISLPLIGEILASGETRKSLAKKIRNLLRTDYKAPVVSIDIAVYASKYVYVMGRVAQPGIVTLRDEPTLVKALALAGGIVHGYGVTTYKSEGLPFPMGKASIVRGNNQIIMVDLDDLFIRGNNALNVSLYPGDVINVFTEMDAYVYVMGEVKNPGSYNLRPEMTLLDAVALAGGYTRDAQAHGVRVVRNAGGENEEILKIDLYDVMKRRDQKQNVRLMAKDIVFMPLKGVAIFNYYMRNTVPSMTNIFLGYTAAEALTP